MSMPCQSVLAVLPKEAGCDKGVIVHI